MIRAMLRADAPSVRIKAETLAASMYPELISDLEKVHKLLQEVTSSEKYYARVIGPEGEPKAALIARSAPNMWAMKKSATILLWYSDVPNGGLELLRDFKRWVREDHQIVMAGITADWNGDMDAVYIAQKVGFKHRGMGTFVFYPHGAKDGSVR